MKLAHKGHDIRNMLNHVAANDEVKIVVGKWIRQNAQIVNNVCISTWI